DGIRAPRDRTNGDAEPALVEGLIVREAHHLGAQQRDGHVVAVAPAAAARAQQQAQGEDGEEGSGHERPPFPAVYPGEGWLATALLFAWRSGSRAATRASILGLCCWSRSR